MPAKSRKRAKSQYTFENALRKPKRAQVNIKTIKITFRPNLSAMKPPTRALSNQPAKISDEDKLAKNVLSHTRSNCVKHKTL